MILGDDKEGDRYWEGGFIIIVVGDNCSLNTCVTKWLRKIFVVYTVVY